MTRHLLLVIVPVCLLAFLKLGFSHQESIKAAAKPIHLQTAKAVVERVDDTLEIPAKVQPDPARVVRVFPPAGGRLLRVAVRPGDGVLRGQVIAVLESSDVSQARADFLKAKAEADKSEHAMARAQLLFDHKVLSEREYQEAEADNISAKSELQRTMDRLRVLGARPDQNSNEVAVTAPISGTVVDIGASSGELSKSTDNANPIATIADLQTVWIVGDVFEREVNAIRPNSPVEVRLNAYPDQSWKGAVSSLSDEVDPQTRTLKLRVVLPNPQHTLKPEMFATIRITRPGTEQIVIPGSAVLREGGDTAVMVETTPDKYERRLVTVKALPNDQVAVLSGLNQGESVVIEAAALARSEAQD